MADVKRYAEWAFLLGAASEPFEGGSLEAGNDLKTEDLKSGGNLNFDLRQVVGKRPFLKASLMDPSAVTAWTEVGAGESVTSVSAIWRAFESNGGLGTGYYSVVMSQGVLVPVQLQASIDKKATLDVVAHATFATGTAFTVGTSSGTAAAVTKAFYPTSATIGGSALENVKSMSVSWNYGIQDDEQLEPSYLFYDEYRREGNIVFRDLAGVTAARLEDSATQTVVLILTDANNGANTVSIDLGNCNVKATPRGGEVTLEFAELG